VGRWRPGPDSAWSDVGVAFGEASLVLTDAHGEPLAHWSLPAVERLNPGRTPALFAPDPEGPEAVEIDDDLMTSAIESVRRVVERRHPGRSRAARPALLATLAAACLAMAIWLPDALRREALSVVPDSTRAEIGATILGHLQAAAGPACRDPLASEALEKLRRRTLGEGSPGQVVVLPQGPEAPLLLPGQIVVVSRDMVTTADEPAALAGYILAAATSTSDPLEPLLGGVGTTLRLLTTGGLGSDDAAREARALLTGASATPPTTVNLALTAAGVPPEPYARALASRGLPTDGLVIEQGSTPDTPTQPLIADADWVSLQNICG
jgi:hypothetical protein